MGQLELLPTAAATLAPWQPTGSLPPVVRKFGKFVSTDPMQPGDLLLCREIAPDATSRQIHATQKAGFDDIDARWTHAALYLGDGASLLEATFTTQPFFQGVKVTALWEYCGSHALRCRRPLLLKSDREKGWLLAIKAMLSLGANYDFKQLLKVAYKFRKKLFGGMLEIAPLEPALICSTLYSQAFNLAFKHRLGEDNGICIPAYLSQSDEFEDVALAWHPIRGTGSST